MRVRILCPQKPVASSRNNNNRVEISNLVRTVKVRAKKILKMPSTRDFINEKGENCIRIL